jgi:hypothetical protein
LKKYGSYDYSNANFIEDYNYLTEEEQEFLIKVSDLIEEGYDYISILQNEYGLSIEYIQDKINIIKEKIEINNNQKIFTKK